MSGVQVVGVQPGVELSRRPRLFAALSEAFPEVRFEAREAGETAELDALIEFGGADEARAVAAAGLPALAALGPESEPGDSVAVEFAGTHLDRRLRGKALPDRHLEGVAALQPEGGGEVLARVAGAPVWTRQGRLDLAAVAPSELAEGEPLRDRLGRERSLALLPLIELLRGLPEVRAWRPPPLRATFLLDDPNLHWPTYGFLSLPRLSAHAAEHGYHLALAMVPLDARVAHPKAARLLREQGGISLCVHGNDHFGGELGRIHERGEALALAAQALRRISAFEQRTGVPVSRVMVPPHEECSEAIATALARTGFAAISMTRPFPWLSAPPRHWLNAGGDRQALAGWQPADVTASGMPVLLRHPVAPPLFSPAEVALRAYLDQPLILYGHHEDLRDGLDLLAERTREIASLGEVRWASMGEIAATNFSSRQDGERLRVRPHSRRVTVEIPTGVSTLVVEPIGAREDESVLSGGLRAAIGEPIPVSGRERVELTLESPDAVSPDQVAPPRREIRRLARRLAGEAHDRLTPTLSRLPGRS